MVKRIRLCEISEKSREELDEKTRNYLVTHLPDREKSAEESRDLMREIYVANLRFEFVRVADKSLGEGGVQGCHQKNTEPSEVVSYIMKSFTSDPLMYEAVVLVIKEVVNKNITMPEKLKGVAFKILDNKIVKPKIKHRPPHANYLRNLVIRQAVHRLVSNESVAKEAAYQIVADATKKIGRAMDFENVKKIYKSVNWLKG